MNARSFPELPAKFSERLAAGYVAKFSSVMIERLRQQRDQFAMALAERQGPHDTIGAILAAMKELDEQSSKSVAEIILMAQQETGMPLEVNGNKATALPDAELSRARPPGSFGVEDAFVAVQTAAPTKSLRVCFSPRTRSRTSSNCASWPPTVKWKWLLVGWAMPGDFK